MKAVHDMTDELFRTPFVNFLLSAVVIKDAIEAEPDVFDLFALQRKVRLLESCDGIRVGRVENENSFVEDFQDLAVLRGNTKPLCL